MKLSLQKEDGVMTNYLTWFNKCEKERERKRPSKAQPPDNKF